MAVFACTHYRHLGQLVLVVVAVVLFCVAADAFSNQAVEIRLIDTFTGTAATNLLTLIAEHPSIDIFRQNHWRPIITPNPQKLTKGI
ncbi:hypothetical protein [Paracidovorax sp. MALMAid1276]|uniref:hypothetical protein n=1 Tax=Paracidovorax sp. MALMAid1276 TaxID=3411631 RepID=UPI003B996F0D